ncbi:MULTISPECIES: alpha/beta fold hydrolase [unclassified Streptomyces]|uniref:alpha/beta fold hydrolase n=1 Tax=Streptomyces TaxID=1883 RepID=UPI00136DC915|nr:MULTISPECIES: alpha/beta fold hydrolase [unclassified Streptomyces]NEA05168.1 alpha/beta fold hydrolase [Streptomyces sp. SID10116]MYY87007.1 alpha/beta fold hydrolase [Streptomyces sp. SID335]MYZ15768.1 alpha/beta fold hydrolase [Streptomyces sp. SID337]NDZ88030.1 alpha/beta fold hydrolase [Streptomyces sp. SID10115]NEB49725.1 alpha/beta fold hydrolase [Streptomyces sp. SID339]
MSTVTVNGATLHFDDVGPRTGLPVLLIHGHPFNRSLWSPQTPALADAGYRVIAPDLRGYGDSSVSDGPVHLGDFADDLAGILDHLGIERAVIGGVSMGGQIAMEMQRSHAGRVEALLLSDTSAPAETPDGKAFRNRLADRLLAEGMDGYADEVIDKMLAAYNVTAMPEVAARVLHMMRATDPRGAAAALRGRAERPDYRDTLPATRCPVLLVVGADDVYTPLADAEVLHRLVPHATLHVIEQAGHLPGAEQPGHFNAALLDFLRTQVLPATAGSAG